MENSLKGQITVEFLLSTIFVIIMLSTLLYVVVDYVPELEETKKPDEVVMEARRISTMLLTSPGSHDYGKGGSNWEKNETTVKNIQSVGLSSDYHVMERKKIENLTESSDGLNYSLFRKTSSIQNQYKFIFTYLPVIHTSEKYRKGDPPETPNITEPQNPDYSSAGDIVRYGDYNMGKKEYNFLVTSHGGRYDTVYKNKHNVDRWNFNNSNSYEIQNSSFNMDNRNFTLNHIQNTDEKSGSMFILSRQFNTFGASIDASASIEKLNRYAVLNESGTELEPVRMEVLTWRKS